MAASTKTVCVDASTGALLDPSAFYAANPPAEFASGVQWLMFEVSGPADYPTGSPVLLFRAPVDMTIQDLVYTFEASFGHAISGGQLQKTGASLHATIESVTTANRLAPTLADNTIEQGDDVKFVWTSMSNISWWTVWLKVSF